MEQFLNEIKNYSGDTVEIVVSTSVLRVNVAYKGLQHKPRRENQSTDQKFKPPK